MEANILRRFDDLPAEEQERIALEVVDYVLEQEHPLCEAARKLLDDRRLRNVEKRPQTALSVYSAEEYAPALKLKTRVVKRDTKRWQRHQERYLRAGYRDHRTIWQWDYGNNLFRTQTDAKPRETLIAMMAGRWPDHGRLSAYAEGSLDRDRYFDADADYFEHAYRDRDGRVFDGIRLYDMWNAQLQFGISDVESIAFLRLIAKDERLVSPIPAKEHVGIYAQIKDRFTAYRGYRDLRHVLAERLLNPAFPTSRIYADILSDIDAAWILMGHSPRRMASFLQQNPTRAKFLSAVAKRKPKPGATDLSDSWKENLEARETLPPLIRTHTLDFLADEGLLGFHRR
jgi:hypothetical protein